MTKKVLLFLYCIFCTATLFAQSFTYPDTVRGSGWGQINAPGTLINTTANPLTITWHIVSENIPTNWIYVVVDNNLGYTNPSIGVNHTTDYYAPNVNGYFGAQADALSGTVGTYYITVNLTSNADGYSKDIVFEFTKKLIADTIFSSTGHSICDTATLSLPGASIGNDIAYQWLYSSDSANWNTVGTNSLLPITMSGYYKAVVSVVGDTVTDTTPVYKLNPPPAPAVSIIVNPDSAIVSGTLVTFSAFTENMGIAPVYQWRKNGVNIIGAISNTYVTNTLADNDTIDCFVKGMTYCGTSDSAYSNRITMHITSEVEKINTIAMSVFPNPTTGTFTIKGVSWVKHTANLQIFNIIGQIIFHTTITPKNGFIEQSLTLPANIPNGVYFIKMDDIYFQTFIIRK